MSDAGRSRHCELRIGTSGWHYKHWLGPFYPADLPVSEMLSFYQQHFDTVEVNNTFYHLPLEGTFENWHRKTPPGFCFAVENALQLRKWVRGNEEVVPEKSAWIPGSTIRHSSSR